MSNILFQSMILLGYTSGTSNTKKGPIPALFQVISQNDPVRNKYYGTKDNITRQQQKHRKSPQTGVFESHKIWKSVEQGKCILIQQIVQPTLGIDDLELAMRSGQNYIATGEIRIIWLDEQSHPPLKYQAGKSEKDSTKYIIPYNLDDDGKPPLLVCDLMTNPWHFGGSSELRAWKEIYQANNRKVVTPAYKALGNFWNQVLIIAEIYFSSCMKGDISLPAPDADAAFTNTSESSESCFVSVKAKTTVQHDGNRFEIGGEQGVDTSAEVLASAALHYMSPFLVKDMERIKMVLIEYFKQLKIFTKEILDEMTQVDIKETADDKFFALHKVKLTIGESPIPGYKFKEIKAAMNHCFAASNAFQWFCTVDGLICKKPAVDHVNGLLITGGIGVGAFPHVFTQLRQDNNGSKGERTMILNEREHSRIHERLVNLVEEDRVITKNLFF